MQNQSKNSVKNQVVISENELTEIGQLILDTVTADELNALTQLQNYYSVYLSLEKESDKKIYASNVELVCKLGSISTKTWANKRSLFNQAVKNGVNVDNFVSELELQKAVKAVKIGTKKVLKNGSVKNDVKNSAKIEAEKIEIQAVNENEIITLMAMPEFKTAVKFLDGNGILKATFMKAWSKHQAKNND